MARRFHRLNERGRRVLSVAQQEAHRLNHWCTGTEHILLGLIREGDGVAATVLANRGIELDKVRSVIEFIFGPGDPPVRRRAALSPRARAVIELSVDEARRLDRGDVGPEHLLLAIIREGNGIAAGILESFDVELQSLRDDVVQALSE